MYPIRRGDAAFNGLGSALGTCYSIRCFSSFVFSIRRRIIVLTARAYCYKLWRNWV